MTHEQNPVDELIRTLKQQRDELALKIHLGKAEARKEWEKATGTLDQLTEEYEPVKDAVSKSADDVAESVKLVADEVLNSFTRIRKSIESGD